jgi:hypothetical protein
MIKMTRSGAVGGARRASTNRVLEKTHAYISQRREISVA